tara:strand:- start:27318 stop:27500 length:183 start_codon:yes stop_codon:yes gene_type:complete
MATANFTTKPPMLLGVLEEIDGRLTKYNIYQDISTLAAWSLLILEHCIRCSKKFITAKGC